MQHTQHIRKTPEKTNSFFSGVFVLTLANVTVKIIGLFFKIPIAHILGDEGMGYFNAAYTIYTWLYMLSTAGFPVAISILVSKEVAKGEMAGAKRVGRISLFLLTAVGAFLTVVLLSFSSGIANLIGSPNARYSIFLIAPTLLLVCISSALRGYYQGYGSMSPTAISQIFEAAGKLIVGVFFGLYAHRKGYDLPLVAAFAIMGVTVGTLFSVAFLFVANPQKTTGRHQVNKTQQNTSFRASLANLLKIAVPITVGSTVMSLSSVIDLGMIMRRLQIIGFSPADAAALYGNYTTLVVPMFNLPSVFVNAIAYAIVPAISAALAMQKREEANKLAEGAIGYTTLIAIPAALGIGAFSLPILSTVFPLSSAKLAAPYLTVISPGIVFICLLAITNSILQANGHPRLPIISLLTGATVKILSGYFLIGNPKVGMLGAPIGTVLCYASASLVNLLFVMRKTSVRLRFANTFLHPVWVSCIAVAASISFDRLFSHMIPNLLRVLLVILISATLYLAIAVKTKLIDLVEIRKIQLCDRFLRVLDRVHHKRQKQNW